MGTTISDAYRNQYFTLRSQGFDHEKAIQTFPESRRNEVEKYIEMSFIESHFGMKDHWFFISIICIITGVILLAIFSFN